MLLTIADVLLSSLNTQSYTQKAPQRTIYFLYHLTIGLNRHSIPGTIEIIRCLSTVDLELINIHLIFQVYQSQALQFLSLPIHQSPQNNHQRLRSISPSRMPFVLLNLTAT